MFLLVFTCKNISYSYQNTDSNKTKTILEKTYPKNPLQILKESGLDSSNNKATALPGGEGNFSPEQDTAFFQALRSNLPINTVISKIFSFLMNYGDYRGMLLQVRHGN